MDTIEYLRTLPETSPKRYVIVQLLAQGFTVQEIAEDRNCAKQTIKNEKYVLFRKTKARNKTHLVHLAHKAGIL